MYREKNSKSIGILYRSSFCLSTASLRILYYSLIYPYLIYCVSVWGLTYNSNLKIIVTFQKKAIRIVAKVPFDSHADPIFRDLEVLKFSDVVLFYLGKFMFFFSKVYFRIHLMTCLHWLFIFILIILETHPIAIFIFH